MLKAAASAAAVPPMVATLWNSGWRYPANVASYSTLARLLPQIWTKFWRALSQLSQTRCLLFPPSFCLFFAHTIEGNSETTKAKEATLSQGPSEALRLLSLDRESSWIILICATDVSASLSMGFSFNNYCSLVYYENDYYHSLVYYEDSPAPRDWGG